MSAWIWSLSRSVLSTSTRKTTWFIRLTFRLCALSVRLKPHGPLRLCSCGRRFHLWAPQQIFDVPCVVPEPDCWFRLIVFVPKYAEACGIEREESSGLCTEP